jgi:methylated-DNA-[protein]-cysteine S-methyltransferase
MNLVLQPAALAYASLATPIGPLSLAGSDGALVRIDFPNRPVDAAALGWRRDPAALREPLAQLAAYFAGELRRFSLPLRPEGTAFQRAVWRALEEIPYGQSVSYAAIAARIGKPAAVRAVGAANGRNPLPIVVPCHRVIGKDGSLTGFGGGLPAKQWLLAHEAAQRNDRFSRAS